MLRARAVRALGELLPTGLNRLSLRDGGRSGLSTAPQPRRGTKWYTEGRRPAFGVPGAPCPRWASTAHPAALRTRQATVTVSALQPTRSAILARVTATWRPVAWSACSAITATMATSVAASIDPFGTVAQNDAKRAEDAQRRNARR